MHQNYLYVAGDLCWDIRSLCLLTALISTVTFLITLNFGGLSKASNSNSGQLHVPEDVSLFSLFDRRLP